MAIARRAARKLLQGGGGAAAVARGVTAFSFGLDGLWQLISGFFADVLAHIVAALAGLVHLLVLPFEALWHLLVAAVAGAVTSGLNSLWHLVTGFFPNLFAALAGAAHNLLVLPSEALWHWLVAAVAGAASAITSGLASLWHLIAGFFTHIFAAFAGAAHNLVVLPIEAFWHWLIATVAGAASGITSGLAGLWHLIGGFITHLFAALAGAAQNLVVLPIEAFWHWLAAAASGAASAISSGLGSLWHLVANFFPNLFAALAGAADQLVVLPLETLWHWVQTAAATALHLVLGAAAVLLVVALICCFGPAICAATVRVCRALVLAACCLAYGLNFSDLPAGSSRISFVRPPRGQQQQDAVQRQQDDEEERLLGVVDTAAWDPEEAEVDNGDPPRRGQRQQQQEAAHWQPDDEVERLLGVVDTAAWEPEEAVVDSVTSTYAWHIQTKGLDESAIAAIGVVVYDASKEQEQQLRTCTICGDDFGDGEVLRLLPPCGHAFHPGCIDPWIRKHTNCPNCRASVGEDADAANAPTEEAERART